MEDDKTIAMGIDYSLNQEGFDTHLFYNACSIKMKKDNIIDALNEENI